MYENPRDELLYDVEGYDIPPTHISKCRCPTIRIQLAGIQVEALVDTGSEISAISEKFYNENLPVFCKLHCLPVLGQAVRGATGSRTVSIKKQIFIPTFLENKYQVDLIFLIIPFLNDKCIIGYDLIKKLGMQIHSESDLIFLLGQKDPLKTYRLSIKNDCNSHRFNIIRKSIMNENLSDFSHVLLHYDIGKVLTDEKSNNVSYICTDEGEMKKSVLGKNSHQNCPLRFVPRNKHHNVAMATVNQLHD